MKPSELQNFKISELLSPEMKLILNAIRVEDKIPPDRENIPDEINWPLVTELAIQHGVLPVVYQYLKRRKQGIVSKAELERQKNLYLSNVARNIQLTQKLLDILKILSKNGFEAIPFKGPVIAVQSYGDIGLRGFCDLDLLIKSEDFPRVYDLIESAGYRSLKPMIGRMKSIWRKSKRNFEFYAKNFFIDFHQQVSQGPSFLDLKDAFQDLSSVVLNSKQVFTLSVENSILMLALHGTHHGWTILKMVADLAHLVYSYRTEIDWNTLVERAGEMGSLGMVLVGLSLGRDFCGLEIPPEIGDLAGRDKKIENLIVHFRGKALEEPKSNLVPITAIPRSLDSGYFKILYWLYYIFNPTNLDVLAIRLPPFLYTLYYVIRPMRLLINVIKGRVRK